MCSRYPATGEPLRDYDCIIIPGTKNTIDDLDDLYQSGTVSELIRARERGAPILGICGGYQMLGRELHDSGVESKEGIYKGLGLLDGVTRFSGYEKNTCQVTHYANPVPPILSGIQGGAGVRNPYGNDRTGE